MRKSYIIAGFFSLEKKLSNRKHDRGVENVIVRIERRLFLLPLSSFLNQGSVNEAEHWKIQDIPKYFFTQL